MSEGGIFITTWTRIDSGYRVWVANVPALAADGETFDEADELLAGVIADATGDGENLREYSPPPPIAGSARSRARAILWDLSIVPRAAMLDPTTLFEDGLCTDCLMPRGPRTGVPLKLEQIERKASASNAVLPKRSPGVGPSLSVYSEEFLTLLTPPERDQFEWRPVVTRPRETRSFYELIVRVGQAPDVSIKGWPTYFGKCATCGWTWVVPKYAADMPMIYVSEKDVPSPLPGILGRGHPAGPSLAASEARWAELVGRPGMRGIVGSLAAVAPEGDVERDPVYEARTPVRRGLE